MNLQENCYVRTYTRILMDSMINRTCVSVTTHREEIVGICNDVGAEDGSGKHYNLVIGNKRLFITLSEPCSIQATPKLVESMPATTIYARQVR